MAYILSASELRRWAMQCRAQASNPARSAAERGRLLKMQESLLALAENADWLADQPSDPRLLQATA